MKQDDVKTVMRILRRVEPIIQRHLLKLIDDYSTDVYLSVVSNLATSMMANGITMVDIKGGDVQQFVDVLMSEIAGKHQAATSAVETEALILKVKGSSTCQPRH